MLSLGRLIGRYAKVSRCNRRAYAVRITFGASYLTAPILAAGGDTHVGMDDSPPSSSSFLPSIVYLRLAKSTGSRKQTPHRKCSRMAS